MAEITMTEITGTTSFRISDENEKYVIAERERERERDRRVQQSQYF